MKVENVGPAYQADRVIKDGSIPESSLDHIYMSKLIQNIVAVKKLQNSSTDHLLAITSINTDLKCISKKTSGWPFYVKD